MDQYFKRGFEKNAFVGALVGTVARKVGGAMPKIFKGLTQTKGKFSPMKTLGTAFGASEVASVAGKARGAANRAHKSMIPRNRNWN